MIRIKIKGARGSGKTAIASLIENVLVDNGFDVDDGDGAYPSCDTTQQIKNIAKYQNIRIKVDQTDS
jgi:uridine kinase